MSIKYVLNPFTGIPEPQEVGTGGPPTGPAGGDLAGTYPNPTVVAAEETSGPTRLAFGAIPDGTALVRSGTSIVGVPYCTSNNVSMPGLYSCAENDSTIASGYASHAEGKGTRAGLALQNFTIPAGGTLVTIAGDVRDQFEQGQPSVRITPVTPAAGATVSRIVASAPAFAAGNTTFNLSAAIDGTTTAGTIVQSDSAAPDNAFGTVPAGGVLVTIAGDVTASFFINQSIRIWPFSPVELADVIRTIVSAPVFAAGNTTFTLNAAIDATTTGAIFYASQARGQGAHAEGVGGVSDGYASHKEGLAIASSNDGSHAEGIGTRALGRGSHAEGWFDPSFFDTGPVAYFNGSHAEGEHTLAGVNDAHAEGVNTKAAGFASHAGGDSSQAGGDRAYAEGDRSIAGNPLRTFTIAAGGTAVTLPGGNFTTEFVNGQRTTFFPQTPFGPGTSAVVSSVPAFGGVDTTFNIASPIDGITTGGLCVDTSFGQDSHAEGTTTRASAASSHSEGLSTVSSGIAAHAQNDSTTASGRASTACGTSTLASALNSTALGNTTQASGLGALSTGQLTVASGVAARSGGFSCTASGDLSQAEGEGCTSSGRASSARGLNTVASALNSDASGAGSAATHEADQAYASGAFAALADAQAVENSFRGTTPGAAPGEAVTLVYGTTPQTNYTLVNLKRYSFTFDTIAHKTGGGAGVPDYVAMLQKFVATVNNAGAVTFSAVNELMPRIVNGATFVGATLLPASGGANQFTMVFTLAGGVTASVIVVSTLVAVESLGN